MSQLDTVKLTHQALSTRAVEQAVGVAHAGGISIFVGTTRDNFDGKRVLWLEYEAYEEMALKQMQVLCTSARETWPQLAKIAVFHRLGRVPIGEASVIIGVSSPHRREAIDACSFIIDKLKAIVPIWKKEMYQDGSSWKKNSEAFRTASPPS